MNSNRGSSNKGSLNENDKRVLSQYADPYFENPFKDDELITDGKRIASGKSIVFCTVDKCFPVKI